MQQKYGHNEGDLVLNENDYLDFVASAAKDKGKVFMLDTGEGNDFVDQKTGWYIEDLSGWLIDENERDRFMCAKKNGTAYEQFAAAYIFVKWSRTSDGDLKIIFKKY